MQATSYCIFHADSFLFEHGLMINKCMTINIQHMSSTAGTLQNTKWQSCIDACMRCAEACEFCATSDLKEQDVKMMASCAQINRECAAVCWTSSALMSMDSQFAKQFCNLCADVCDACAQECEHHDVDHCKQCAQACRNCAEECRKMAR
jgi:hypothetical protein